MKHQSLISGQPINLIYFGSPAFSSKILKSLLFNPLRTTYYELRTIGLVTSPDVPLGRNKTLTPSPVASLAASLHLPTFKPAKLDDSNLAHIKLLKPDLFLVVSYGQIIPQTWLETPRLGVLNLHFSLLPKYRGALCISQAIKNQDQETGITLMAMDEQLDHGPIITQVKVPISTDDDVASLTQRLTSAAIKLLTSALPDYLSGKLTATPQDHSQATFTPTTKTRTRDSAFVSWQDITTKDPATIHALIRSLNPDPGAWTQIPTNRGQIEAKILKTNLTDKLNIETIQLPSRSPISFQQFLAGYSLTL